jgi:hypothetical protein
MLLYHGPRVLALLCGLSQVGPALELVNTVLETTGPLVYLVWAGVFVVWVYRSSQGDPWSDTLLFVVGIYALSPGFGIQWLVWALPLWLVIDRRHAIVYSLLASTFIAGSYWQWGLNPKYGVRSITANLHLLSRGDLLGILLVGCVGLLTWIYCVLAFWRMVRQRRTALG